MDITPHHPRHWPERVIFGNQKPSKQIESLGQDVLSRSGQPDAFTLAEGTFLDRRNVMYPYPKTFCVVRDPLARLASAVYYQMENKDRRKADAGDAASFNAHIRSRMAMQMRRGHQTFFWPQAYFTPFCDVVLRFESLKRDFDGLMAKIGCPLRLPEQRNKARGNRLLPLLADDVVASVRRMYADDYSLVKRLAGLGLDDLLANATRLT